MSAIWKIIKLTGRFWPYYLVSLVLVIIISLLNLAGPLINKNIVDLIVDNIQTNTDHLEQIIWLLVLFVVVDLSITLLTSLSGYLGDILGQKLNTFLTSKFYKKVLSLEVAYFDNELSGKILNKLQRGIQNITVFINQMNNSFLPFFLTAFFTVIFLGFYSWEIAVLLTILFPIYILISDKSSRVWIARQNEINGIQDTAFGRVLESITSIRVVKSFLRQQTEYDTFLAHRYQIEGLTKTQSKDYYKFDFARRLLLNLILLAIYAYIIYNTYVGRFSISELILLIQLVNQARFPLFAMSFIISQIQQAQAGSKDFFEIINQEPQIKDKPNAGKLAVERGQIEFREVSFAYGEDKQVLKNINFTIQPGQKLAIIGESGEGKSTIANLLLRYYEPNGGQILIDEQDILEVQQKSLHQHIAVVLQDATLFSGTIRENISYGQPEASLEEIEQAAKAANAEGFIQKLPQGLETEIGEKGIKLSGGQKQRISIARAIVKDAPILILDEATSSLDSKAEQEVQKALDKLMENRTTIIIAHRLATIKNANHIIVLKEGKILEEGKPDKLYAQGGIYTELVNLQSLTADQRKENQTLKDFHLGQ